MVTSMVEHKVQHKMLGLPEVSAVVDTWTDSKQVYASPIAGDPDLARESHISGAVHTVTGFLLPKAGILEEIHMECQGNTGSGINRSVRWCVCSIKRSISSATGLAVDKVIATGLTNVADNSSGDVTLATALALAVPSQFVITIKAPFKALATEQIWVQNTLSAGALPGVIGTYTGTAGLVSAATYIGGGDIADPPEAMLPDDGLNVSDFKGLTQWIEWRGE